MRERGHMLLVILGVLLLGLVLWQGAETAVIVADENGALGYLPAVFRAEPEATPTPTTTPSPTGEPTPEPTVEPTPEPTLSPQDFRNGGFEEGWTDVDGDKQQPNGWELTWVKPGEPLYDSGDLATNSCECIHKMGGPDPDPNPPNPTLPEDEWLGGPNALVLDGLHTYKAFRANAAWGTQMSQEFTLPPGSQWRLSVPVQLHDHNGSPGAGYDAESSVWVNDEGAWAQIGPSEMVDHQWCKHEQSFVVPAGGQVRVDIRFKVKYELTFDFWMDFVQLLPAGSADPYPDFPLCVDPGKPLETYRPYSK